MPSDKTLSSAEVVQGQLDAYNRRDLEAFVQFYDPKVELFNLSNSKPRVVGLTELRSLYEELFKESPNLHCKLVHRISVRQFVVDHEDVTGLRGLDVQAVAVYEVRDNFISKVWFLK